MGHRFFAGSSLWVAGAALLLLSLSACSIEEPRLPDFESEWLIPIGELEYTIEELLEEQDGLEIAEDGSISLRTSGQIDEVEIGDVLDLAVEGQVVDTTIGPFQLAADDPTEFAFELSTLYPPSVALHGQDTVVPPFPFTSDSPPQDLPGIESAQISSGGIDVTVVNGLPVPVGAMTAPDRIHLDLINPVTSTVLASVDVDGEIASGESQTTFLDLTGVTLPGDVAISLAGGSPGSSGNLVTVNAASSLLIAVLPVDLVANQARAEIGEKTFTESSSLDLPETPKVLSAEVESGHLEMTFTNQLTIPVDVVVRIPAFVDGLGQPLRIQRVVQPATFTSCNTDMSLYRLDFGGDVGERVDVFADMTTQGSEGQVVDLSEDDRVRAEILPFDLTFSEITGIVDPEEIELPSSTSSLELPEELDDVELASAELRFTVRSTVGMPSQVDVRVDGTNDDGESSTLDLQFMVPAAPAGGALLHEVVFDQNNSDLVTFLNALPTELSLGGTALVGDGVTVGTVATDDAVSATYDIEAPMLLVINAQEIELDPVEVELDQELRDQLAERLVSATLETTVSSSLPIAVSAWIALDEDSAELFVSPQLLLGPIELAASVVPRGEPGHEPGLATSQLNVPKEHVPVITQSSLFQGVRLVVPGTEGAVVPVRADDRILVTGFVRVKIHVGEGSP